MKNKTLDRLNPFVDDDTILAVIETPKHSRNKWKYEPDLGSFKLSKVLPEGMDFPFDFGFIPRTKAEDGDPIDIIVLQDEPAYPGCLIEVRLVAVCEGEQSEQGKKKTVRNDRLLSVAVESLIHAKIDALKDLDKNMLAELEQFFINYNRVQGRKYKGLGWKDSDTAMRLFKESMRSKQAA